MEAAQQWSNVDLSSLRLTAISRGQHWALSMVPFLELVLATQGQVDSSGLCLAKERVVFSFGIE